MDFGESGERATGLFLDAVGELIAENRKNIPTLWSSSCKVRDLNHNGRTRCADLRRIRGQLRFESSSPVVLQPATMNKNRMIAQVRLNARPRKKMAACPAESCYRTYLNTSLTFWISHHDIATLLRERRVARPKGRLSPTKLPRARPFNAPLS